MGRKRVRKSFDLDPVLLATLTPLERFLRENDVKPAHVAAVSGYSRQHLVRVRAGRMEPTRRCAAAILAAVRILSGNGTLKITEIFSFEDGPVELDKKNAKARKEALDVRSRILDDAPDFPRDRPGWGWRHWKVRQKPAPRVRRQRKP
jgi:hypothetical protein